MKRKTKVARTLLTLCLITIVCIGVLPTVNAAENWLWPIDGYYNISSGYGQRSFGWHSGIDIDSYGVGNITGKPVRASKSGYATVYHNDASAGNYISIDHGDGYVSRYLHLDSIAISSGNVTRGQTIGYAGNTGNSTGSHLHFDIKYNGAEVNPMPVDYSGKHTYYGSTAPLSKSICYSYSTSLASPFYSPSNVCVSINNTNVVVSWESVSNAIYYRCEIVRGGDPSFPYAVDPIYTNYTNCTFSLDEGTYYVYVTALNEGGESNSSEWHCFNITNAKPEAPVVQCADPAYYFKGDEVTLSWNSVANAEKYSYYLAQHPTGHAYSTPTRSGVTSNTSVSFSDLSVGEYVFFVHANNEYGSSPQSNWVGIVVNDMDYVPVATEIYDNHIYALYDNWTSWSYAKEICEKMGGHLVTITSKEENQFIETFIRKGKNDGYWIGLTDESQITNDFKWITEEPFSFTDWALGDPNNYGEYGSREDYVQIHKNYSHNWIDTANCSDTSVGFVLEIELEDFSPTTEQVHNGSKYSLFDHNMTWTEARKYCEKLGGHLVTINSEEEYEFMAKFLELGKRDWYLLGGIKKDGSFKWIDANEPVATSVATSHWLDDCPTSNTNSNYMMMYKDSKKWYELKNFYEYSDHMKYLGFVCEIESHQNDENAPTVTIGTVKARAGQIVEIPVYMENNPGIAGMQLSLHYDERLTLSEITAADALSGLTFIKPGDLSVNPAKLPWDGLDADSSNGQILILSFTVPEGAEEGDYSISLSYNTGDIYDNDLNDVEFTLVSGGITVVNFLPGDINGDGVINTKDITVLRRYNAGGYTVNVVEDAVDVNGDGTVNTKDITILRRYNAGGYGIELN